jgi:hypothetical protein
MAAPRQKLMNESATVVATTTLVVLLDVGLGGSVEGEDIEGESPINSQLLF